MTVCPRAALLAGLLPAALAATGCPPVAAYKDAPDTDPDGGSGGTGLRVAWNSRPEALPAPISRRVTLERAVLRVRAVRAIGDAGTIALSSGALEWARDTAPPPHDAPEAPPGLYSRLLFELDPGAEQ